MKRRQGKTYEGMHLPMYAPMQ